MATSTIKGRVTAGTGDPEDLSATQVRTLINVANGATVGADWSVNLTNIPANITSWAGIAPTSKQNTLTSSTTNTISGTEVQRAALTGDVTATANSNATTIANDAVSNAKLANVATATIKGRATAGAGDPEDLSAAQVRTLINVADGATANATDAALRDRATHTGTQLASTISDFNASSRAQVEATLIAGTNVTITPAGSGATRTLTIAASGGGGGALEVLDEGSSLTAAATSINFTGSGVTATNSGTAVTVNVAGGGSTAITGPALAGRTSADLGPVSAITLGHGLYFLGSAIKANAFPIRVNNATNTLLDSDIGLMVVKDNTTTYTWTLPPDATFTSYATLGDIQGKCIALVNDGTGGNITIARGSGVSLFNGTSNANITLGPGQSIVICHMAVASKWRVL
jgi:hypothetical protein